MGAPDLDPGPLAPARLYTACDAAQFDFEDTSDLPEPELPFGQERAMAALQLALDTPGRGYNVFVLGEPGSGRHAAVRRRLDAHAAHRPAPNDCCYLYNFSDPQRPRVLTLPPGEGARLRGEMQAFVSELGKAIEAGFEGDEYRSRLEAIQKEYKQREEEGLQALGDSALAQGVALVRTPQGFSFTPLKGGEPMRQEEFDALPEADRQRLAEVIRELGERLLAQMQKLPRLRREMQVRIREASHDTMALAAGHLIDELKESFARHPEVLGFLEEVLQDVIETGEHLRTQASGEDDDAMQVSGTLSLTRYEVNLLVGHAADAHAPVVTCDNPTYPALVGRVDHVAHLGTLLTNFTMVKAGALHRANGGYLLLDALQLLSHAGAWEGLKRALKGNRVTIESLPESIGLGGGTPALEPQPVPLSLKVILIGERHHYYLLQALDSEFDQLFRIGADYEDDAPRTPHTIAGFAQFVGAISREQQLRPCEPSAVARLVEHAARIAGRADRLSTRTQLLEEALHEADTEARRAGHARVTGVDVQRALDAREQRSDRVRDRLQDEMLERSLLIATEGVQVGQVNGLAVVDLGDFRFGRPLRITATARLGDDRVVDIERESALGQPLHSKGVLILSACLGARYAANTPLSFAASLVFEQSYGPVEGDSASLAELCALLSALGGVPVRQSLAVTGSINQFGIVQAIGAVNEKVEGFFDACRARGLTGSQGVLLPASNVPHLMLRQDLVAAVAAGRFHIYPVEDVDDALVLLSGLPAGRAEPTGAWEPGSFNHAVATRLEQLSLARQTYGIGQRPRIRRARHKTSIRVHIGEEAAGPKDPPDLDPGKMP
jgi:lon-related putative ATP-dependent protease